MFGKLFKKTINNTTLTPSEKAQEFYNMGCKANKKGKYEKGIEYFNQAINFDPNYSNAYINRGNAYSRLADTKADISFYKQNCDKAISDYSQAIEIDSSSGYAYYNRSVAKYVKGDYKSALEDLERSKQLNFTDIDPSIERDIVSFAEKFGNKSI